MTRLQHIADRARRYLLTMIYHAGSGHPGGSLSAIDALTYLYFQRLKHDPKHPDKRDRDRFVLSKGHAAPALYAIGALAGYLTKHDLGSFRKTGGKLQGHPHVGDTPWVETSTGSLGQGFSAATGMALGLRHKKIKANVYVMLGDGELQEGEVWEAAMFAAHHKISNLCAMVDYNKMQSDDLNANIMGLEPLADKWRAFGWHVISLDGHSFAEMEAAFADFDYRFKEPTVLILDTIKGKGVSYMEGVPAWHGSVKLRDEELVSALQELGADEGEIESCLSGRIWEE